MSNYDFHIHSTYSDGVLTPSQIAEVAAKKHLKAFAVTDHDGVGGVDEAMERADQLGIQCISGIEISTFDNFEIHILGYNFDHKSPAFLEKIKEIKELRKNRNFEIIRKLRAHGLKIKINDEKTLGEKGRAYIADLLYEQKFVLTRNEAFDKYIGSGGPCYVSSMRVTPQEAVKLILEAGGVASLAHPYRFIKEGILNEYVKKLAAAGLGGIEVYYNNYGRDVKDKLKSAAMKNGLICTGGGDYHSSGNGAEIGEVKVCLDKFALEKLNIR